MTRYIAVVLAAAMSATHVFALPAPKKPEKVFDWAAEVAELSGLDKLPLYRSGTVEQISSYDPTGGNDDGFSGKYSYVRKEGGRLVLADLKGPGVINRIWTPTPTADTVSFYFDGEKKPRLSLRFRDLFSGDAWPFVKPVCGNEAGGFYCYLPIPYEKSCKIVFHSSLVQFHQIQYRNLPGCKVRSYDPGTIEASRAALDEVCEKWSETAAPGITGAETDCRTFLLAPGEEFVFFDAGSGGRIAGFEIDGGAGFEGLNKDVILSAVWDGESTEAIYAPVADFFGYAYGKRAMRSFAAGSRGDINYFYLPCPFDDSAQLKLIYKERPGEKQNTLSVTTTVYHTGRPRDKASEGKLYTAWNREKDPPKGRYYPFLGTSGKGHYVGVVHQAQGLVPGMTLFFEGDDSVRVDGRMRIHGTGSEDAYNGGWYALMDRWDRGVSLPLHGSLDYSLPMARTGGYRFYLSDKLSFESDIYAGIEHGPEGNEYPVDYTSVAYYYCDTPPASRKEPDEALRTVYVPREHIYYPQLMDLNLSWGTETVLGEYIKMMPEGSYGRLRVNLGDIPEGRYRVYLTYVGRPGGADFSVWQRQNIIGGWKQSAANETGPVEKTYVGDMEITNQTNSLTIHVRGNGGGNEFEFGRLFLEKTD